MYSDLDSIGRQPSDIELKRLYAILYHDKDIQGLERFSARFDLDQLYPDETPELPHVTEKEIKKYFDHIWKTVRKVRPQTKKTPSKDNPMEKYSWPGQRFRRPGVPGSPSLTNYFYTDAEGTVYFLKRSYLEDQPKKWLLSFARKNNIFVTTPTMIKGTVDDLSLNGLVLQILDDPRHLSALIDAMQKRRPKLSVDDRDDFINVESKRLIENQDLIVSEDLKAKNLLKNHKLAYSISDVSWSAFFTMLEQKSSMYGKVYVKVPPHNTTQTCSACGYVMKEENHIALGISEWDCPVCNTHHIRDHNAAKNILNRGIELLYSA